MELSIKTTLLLLFSRTMLYAQKSNFRKTLLITIAILITIGIAHAQKTGTLQDNRDGIKYSTVKIGSQWWMAENLAFIGETGYYAYENDFKNAAIYGCLYDWETATKVCPTGWHLPSINEWDILINYLGGEDVAGGKMKESNSYWKSPNANATNSSGFSAKPGGYRGHNNGYQDIGINGNWWSSTPRGIHAWGIGVDYDVKYVSKATFSVSKCRLSVRCIKD